MTIAHPSRLAQPPSLNDTSWSRRALKNIGSIVPHLIGFATLFLAWHIASTYLVRSVLFPPPLVVFSKALKLAADVSLFENIFASLRRIAIGFFAGSAIGVPVGLAIG